MDTVDRPLLCVALIQSTLGLSLTGAQTTTAVLRGTVTDTTGAVLPDARVEVLGPTGQRSTVADAVGFYRLANLPPGNYSITVTRDGFRGQQFDDLLL